MKSGHFSSTRGLAPRGEGDARVRSGISRLDDILKGGFFPGRTYTLTGPPGSGKTILGNQLCFNHASGSAGRCVYLTLLVESYDKMLHHMESLAFDRTGQVGDRIFCVSGYPTLRKEGLAGLLDLIRGTVQVWHASMLVVDGLECLREFAGEGQQQAKEFVHEIQAFTSMIGCTTLLMSFKAPGLANSEHAVVDGVLELSDTLVGPRAVRELTVHKFRGGDYLRGRHEVEITGQGLVIHPRTEIQFDLVRATSGGEALR